MFDKIVGIDPGSTGGIAVFGRSGMAVTRMPVYQVAHQKHGKERKKSITDVGRLQLILEQQKENYKPIVFIERVQAWVSDTDDNPGKRFMIQRMLANYETLKTAMSILNVPFIEVRPIDWQKYLNLYYKDLEKRDRKRKYLQAAKEFYPGVKATLWSADAICLVHFGRMKLKLDPDWIIKKLKPGNDQIELL